MHVDEDDYVVLEETAETVVSYIEDQYDVSIGIPDFLGNYRKMGVGMKYVAPEEYQDTRYDPRDDRAERRQQFGAIKILSEPWTAFGRLTDIAHELGHAALYQNTDFAALKDDSATDDTICKGISEAVAYDVERHVKQQYLRDNAANPSTIAGSILPYTLTSARYRIQDAFDHDNEPHVLGRRILDEYGPIAADAFDDPQQVYNDVVTELDDHAVTADAGLPVRGAAGD